MKANRKLRISDDSGFTFILPMTLAIVVGFAILAIGAYVVGEVSSTLEGTFANNQPTGTVSYTYWYNSTTTGQRNVTLPTGCYASDLTAASTKFQIYNTNASFPIQYNLTTNGATTYDNQSVAAVTWHNTTLATLKTNNNVSNGDAYLCFNWSVNNTTNRIIITVTGSYTKTSDYRTTNQNDTVFLLGNITDGFSDVVDIEIVVIIITALSMAIFAVMAVGTRRGYL